MSILTLEEQLLELQLMENENAITAQQNEESYTKKVYEILEGEIREVVENEGQLIRENPLDFPEAVQRKYFGASAEDWKFPDSLDIDAEGFETPEGKYIQSSTVTNPYTLEERNIYELREIYIPHPPSNLEIGEKITQDVFGGNPYAQLADMVKAQVITLALLVPVLGKETVKAAYSDLLETVQKVSESRVSQGLEPYDLSFLD